MRRNMGIVLHSQRVSNLLRSQDQYTSFINSCSTSIQLRYNSDLCAREQLLEDIVSVYNDLVSTTRWRITEEHLAQIVREITLDEYHLSPLEYLQLPSYSFAQSNFSNLLSSYPDLMIIKSRSHRGCIEVLLPHKEDVCVYTGLARFLYRLSCSSLPHNDDMRILNKTSIESFYRGVLGRRVQRLYSIELDESFNYIPKSFLLETLKPILLDRTVYRLVSELMELNIYHKDTYLPPSPYGIPPLGEICRVLFDLFLSYSFDKAFALLYPSIEFTRYYHTVFLFISYDEQEQAFQQDPFYSKGFEDMLAEHELINGYIKSIETLGSMHSRIGPVNKVFRIAPDGTLERGEDRFDCI